MPEVLGPLRTIRPSRRYSRSAGSWVIRLVTALTFRRILVIDRFDGKV